MTITGTRTAARQNLLSEDNIGNKSHSAIISKRFKDVYSGNIRFLNISQLNSRINEPVVWIDVLRRATGAPFVPNCYLFLNVKTPND